MNNKDLEREEKPITIQDLIDEITKDAILVVDSNALLFNPSRSGTVITKDKKLYTYNKYLFGAPVWLYNHNMADEEICLIKKLNDEEIEKVEDFIRKEVFENKPESVLLRDGHCMAYGSVDGKSFKVLNNHAFLSKARGVINEIKNPRKKF